jgi:uncharacterized protein
LTNAIRERWGTRSNLVISRLSGIVTEDGITVEVSIVRMEDETDWTLEVVNHRKTSIVWDDPFPSDMEAYAAFRKAVTEEGMASFLDHAKVIPFPKR